LNTLALGRYYLGNISINQDLLRYHPIVEDWYFNKNLQKRWNNEVFSKIKNVTDMELWHE
jgi:hypothetical protein